MQNSSVNSKMVSCEMLFDGVLKGIQDIIGVYGPDNTVLFYNEAGYEFFNVKPEDVVGRKCYEMLCRNCRCDECSSTLALKNHGMVRFEKYMPEMDRFMDCSCNPIYNSNGELLLLVEQLRDITERKKLELSLKESEMRYRSIIDLSPEAIIIVVDNYIVFANKEAARLSGISYEDLIGKNIYDFIIPEHYDFFNNVIEQMFEDSDAKVSFDYRLERINKERIDIEISASRLRYKGKPAVQAIIRNITEMKKELNRAKAIQKKSLPDAFPIADKIQMEVFFRPARTVSGDFYNFCRIGENQVLGIVGDVSGKGISAALNISAFNVIFRESLLVYTEPIDIISNINKKVADYLGENYIAVCCFKIDFEAGRINIASAGINEFSYYSAEEDELNEITVHGPFLGMFENSEFDEITVDFKQGDELFFYTDGLELMFEDNESKVDFLRTVDIDKIKTKLNELYNKNFYVIDKKRDDCTLIAIKII